HPQMSFGVLVIPDSNEYTEEIKNAVRCCSHNTILIDVENVVNDIERHCISLKKKEYLDKDVVTAIDDMRKNLIKMRLNLDKWEYERNEK
ncbi:9181_t:CDS:1, partial [Dentiscutata heterogama]